MNLEEKGKARASFSEARKFAKRTNSRETFRLAFCCVLLSFFYSYFLIKLDLADVVPSLMILHSTFFLFLDASPKEREREKELLIAQQEEELVLYPIQLSLDVRCLVVIFFLLAADMQLHIWSKVLLTYLQDLNYHSLRGCAVGGLEHQSTRCVDEIEEREFLSLSLSASLIGNQQSGRERKRLDLKFKQTRLREVFLFFDYRRSSTSSV